MVLTVSLHTEDNMDIMYSMDSMDSMVSLHIADSMVLPTEGCHTDTIHIMDLVVDLTVPTTVIKTTTVPDGILTAVGWSRILRVITEVDRREPTNITDVHRLSRVLVDQHVDCPITGME